MHIKNHFNNKSTINLIVIIGPTATGKTRIAALLANKIDGEIISGDSRQVYREMTIGTGKDYDDYIINNKKIKYHLIDIANPGEKYNLFQFQNDFFEAYNSVIEKNKKVILCGGSGLYIDSVLRTYTMPEVPQNDDLRASLAGLSIDELKNILLSFGSVHNSSDFDTAKRAIRAIEIAEYKKQYGDKCTNFPKLNYLCFGIDCERETRRNRISTRLEKRTEQGLIQEVEHLLNLGLSYNDLIYYGLEYKFTCEYILGKYSKSEFLKKLETAIHQFAKRQMTFFRAMEKKGVKINWISRNKTDDEIVENMLSLIDYFS